MNIYKTIFEALKSAKVDYLIVGGVAVNLYGYNRFTGDIDIIVWLDKKNLDKIDKVVTQLGYIPRLPVNIQELGNKKKLTTFIKEKGLKAYTFIANQNPQLDIDIIIDESTNFKKLANKKTIIKIWDIELPVIHIDDLMTMKKKAGRDKDLLDLKALLNLKSL